MSPTHFTEEHGGVEVPDSYYKHICFYYPDNKVGFFGSDKSWSLPFTTNDFKYKGEITWLTASEIQFYIADPFVGDSILCEGKYDEKQLHIVARRSGNEAEIFWQESFEYIGTGNQEEV